ncbi:hypothetical protein ACVXG7_28075 [Enterobacter hormaechei]
MSLVNVPGAVEFLVTQIKKHNLQPEQVIIEVTENEMISGFNQFNSAIKQLRAGGVGLAIDDLVPAMLVFRCSRGSSRINSKSTERSSRYPPERAQAGDCEVDNQLLHRSGDYAGRRRH